MSRMNWEELRKELADVNRQEVLIAVKPDRAPPRLMTGMTDGLIPPIPRPTEQQKK